MATDGRLFATLITLVVISTAIGHATDPSESGKVEGRLQSYESYFYNDVQYWWPWFTDLSTVIMIKLKLAIGLAAIYAFGDGYYWTKTKEVSHEAVTPNYLDTWTEPAACFSFKKFWGRRKRDLSGAEVEHPNYLEVFFDLFEINDEHCRKLAVCEMDFEASGEGKLNGSTSFRHDLFGKYRGTVPKQKSDCRRMYSRCSLWANKDQGADSSIDDHTSEMISEDS
ncbi:uncharacterized protein LOC135708237 [Ochlerotatus camptorhynchus]|uniref:uncharacterized protein LOC135708237 n=1 Tax=Ochlerotatus camptorhynchus TaxID=644619 RepID=UPI0031D7E41E